MMVREEFQEQNEKISYDNSSLDELDDMFNGLSASKQSHNSEAGEELSKDNDTSLLGFLNSLSRNPVTEEPPVLKVSTMSGCEKSASASLNPFIHNLGNHGKSSALHESLIPDLPSVPISASAHQKLIQDAAKKQEEAQAVFRSLSSGPSISPVIEIPKRGNSLFPPTLPLPVSHEEFARKERLTSLGIFDVSPRSKSPNPEVKRLSQKLFATPPHQRPEMLQKDIRAITGPQLVSTSSRIQTVPISEILKDLKASGRLVEETGEERKKKGFFRIN